MLIRFSPSFRQCANAPIDADMVYGQTWLLGDAKLRCPGMTLGFFD